MLKLNPKMLTMFLVFGSLAMAADNPFTGKWKIDAPKSSWSDGKFPKNMSLEINMTFKGDDLRKSDPKFQGGRFQQYLAAVEALRALARQRFNNSVLALAVRWVLDQGPTIALWGARFFEAATRATDDRAMARCWKCADQFHFRFD